MKTKTIAESIAELRNRLEEIDSSSSAVNNNLLQESSGSLHSHMQAIESEYLSERGVIGGALDFAGNLARGLGGQTARGAAKDWEVASKSDVAGNVLGKAGLGYGALQGWEAAHDRPNMWADLKNQVMDTPTAPTAPTAPEKPTAPVTPEKPTAPVTPEPPTDEPTAPHKGGGAKPHKGGGSYDPATEQLQQYLNSKGANLVVDGIRGPKTNAAIAQFMPADGQAPAGQTAPTAPTADADYNKQMQSSLDQLKDLMAKIQQISGNDPAVAQDLQNIMKPLQ